MAKAVGVGGVFLRSKDPKALYAWYAERLGLSASPDDTFLFDGVQSPGITVVAFFPLETEYFGPGGQRAMLNFCVDDLEGVLRSLGSAGSALMRVVSSKTMDALAGLPTRKGTVWNFGSLKTLRSRRSRSFYRGTRRSNRFCVWLPALQRMLVKAAKGR